MAQSVADCPVCGAAMPASLRYPHAICGQHSEECFDADGNPVTHFNADAGGGFVSRHAVNGVVVNRSDPVCYVRNRKCHASEHRFGGIVIQLCDDDNRLNNCVG
jgi:hypothetical protein